MQSNNKYIEMVRLSAQIDVLQELPYQSVYKADAQLNDLKMKSAILMDDLIKVLGEKREKLAVLDGSKQITKLKKEIEIWKVMKKYRFYKEGNNWYVDLPEWPGAKSDLLMIGGADTMLDIMSDNRTEVWVAFSTEEFEGSNKLEYLESAEGEIGEGAFYELEKYEKKTLNLRVFLCDVCKFVFGDFPKQIYVQKI